jgi:NAD(P) transhydrogenase subunit beta
MSETLRSTGAPIVYILAAIALFLSLKAIPRVRQAGRGRVLAFAALALAAIGALLEVGVGDWGPLLGVLVGGGVVGVLLASRVNTDTPPARLAWIPACGGVAVTLLAYGALPPQANAVSQWAFVGARALGSVSVIYGVALALRGTSSAKDTAVAGMVVALVGTAIALLGVGQENVMLLVSGAVLGTSGIAFSRIVAASAGRGLGAMLFGQATADPYGYTNVRACGLEEAAAMLDTARQVAIIPGYGMAAAKAQHATKEIAEWLERRGVTVRYAIHPVAGVIPGHMNIALDEAGVPHELLIDGQEAGKFVAAADAVLVIGANDVVNAEVSDQAQGPLSGIAAVDLSKARQVFVVKRSLRPGAAGVKNPLFERPNTMMLFGDAKKLLQGLMVELKGAGH